MAPPTGDPVPLPPPPGSEYTAVIPLGGIDPSIATVDPTHGGTDPGIISPDASPILSPLEADTGASEGWRKAWRRIRNLGGRAVGMAEVEDPDDHEPPAGHLDLGGLSAGAASGDTTPDDDDDADPTTDPTYWSSATPPPYWSSATPPPYTPTRPAGGTPPPPPPPGATAPTPPPSGESPVQREIREARERQQRQEDAKAEALRTHQQIYDERLRKVQVNEALRVLAGGVRGVSDAAKGLGDEFMGPNHSLGKRTEYTLPAEAKPATMTDREFPSLLQSGNYKSALEKIKDSESLDRQEYKKQIEALEREAYLTYRSKRLDRKAELLTQASAATDPAESARLTDKASRIDDELKHYTIARWRDARNEAAYKKWLLAKPEAERVDDPNKRNEWAKMQERSLETGFGDWKTKKDASEYRAFLAKHGISAEDVSFDEWDKDGHFVAKQQLKNDDGKPLFEKDGSPKMGIRSTKIGIRYVDAWHPPVKAENPGYTVDTSTPLPIVRYDLPGLSGPRKQVKVGEHPANINFALEEILGHRNDITKKGDPLRTALIDSWDLADMEDKLEQLKAILAERAAAKPGDSPIGVRSYPGRAARDRRRRQ